VRVKIGKSRRTRSTSRTVGAREETAVGVGVIGLFPPEVSSHEDGEKAREARPDCEHCQLAFGQLGNVIDRHVRCLGQGFEASLVRGAFARLRGRGKLVHVSLASCVPELPACKSGSMPLGPGMMGRHQPVEKPLEPAVCFRPHTSFPCPFVQPVVFQMWRYTVRESPQATVFEAIRPLSYTVISTFRTLPPNSYEHALQLQHEIPPSRSLTVYTARADGLHECLRLCRNSLGLAL
jgi:hypothetical protein